MSKIGWTERTVNPFRAYDPETEKSGHFCQMVSEGCVNCYASNMQTFMFGMHNYSVQNREKVDLYVQEEALLSVIRRKKPTVYFWCSMTDMFWDEYPDEWIDKCFATMYETPGHLHLVLTKHPERAKEYLSAHHTTKRVAAEAHRSHIARHPV